MPLRHDQSVGAGVPGLTGSKRISANSAAMMSAADWQVVGCPLPAAVVARMDSIRSRVARFLRLGSSDTSTGKQEPSGMGTERQSLSERGRNL